MTEEIIEVRNLVKTFSLENVQVHALRGISLTIRRGEYVAVMGTSGSGKSTLMNILGCLDQPTSGSYLLDGTAVAGLNRTQLAGGSQREDRLRFPGLQPPGANHGP